MSIFNRIAHWYDKFVGEFDLEEIREYLPLKENATLVDLGGGTGRLAYQLSQYVKECIVVDASIQMLQQAKKYNSLPLIQSIAEKMPFLSNSIDQIFLNDSLHHIRKQQETINECFRVLVPGGELIIREFDKSNFGNIPLIIGEAILLLRSKFLSPKQLTKMCEKAGFTVTWQKPTKKTFILIATK